MAFDKASDPITQSILQYKKLLFNDINLSLRLTEKNSTCHITRILRWDEDRITFYAPLSQRDWVIFYMGDVVDICFLSKSGMYMSTMKLDHKFINDGNLYYGATILSPLVKKQQREHFRLDALLPITFKVIAAPNFSPEQLETMPIFKGSTVNISAGGMCIVCDKRLDKDTQLSVELHFLNQKLTLLCHVLGKGDRNENGTYLHRIMFCNIDFRTESLISKLIFEKQRIQRINNTTIPLYKK